MIDVRSFNGLGHANHGWLDARHHFSFGQYHDAARMGWGSIRVWNDDTIAPQTGFDPHPHADMEIVTYVRTGAITHKDSLGNTGRTAAGDVQVMSAGTGIRHAEYNLEAEVTSLFQIWIEPATPGGAPSWGTRPFLRAGPSGQWDILASGDPADAALMIRANARVMGAVLAAGETLDHVVALGRHAYLVAATGAIMVNGKAAGARDGVAITGGQSVRITAHKTAELVLVDAP